MVDDIKKMAKFLNIMYWGKFNGYPGSLDADGRICFNIDGCYCYDNDIKPSVLWDVYEDLFSRCERKVIQDMVVNTVLKSEQSS